MLKVSNIKTFVPWLGAIAVLLLIALKLSFAPIYSAEAQRWEVEGNDKSEIAREIIEDRLCPCGCERFLPGSSRQDVCFGCSVGKAEVSRIVEGLAAGRTADEITKQLVEPVLVDVFSDYTDSQLWAVWKRAKRLAGEYNQHRVVLRPLGFTSEARRAIKLVECARVNGIFFKMQEVMIEHNGPWDERTLIDLGIKYGMNGKELSDCLGQMNVDAQIAKDRQHAQMLKIKRTPAVSVNRKLPLSTDEEIRRAIRRVIMEETI